MRIYLATFFTVLSTAVLPLPEEAPLLAAGWVSRAGHASVWLAGLCAWAAVFVGDLGSYWLGRGPIHRLVASRFGARLLPEERRVWAERLVARHGWRAIVIARFLVGLRGFVYIAIGASRYRFRRFAVIDGAIGLVEVGLVVALGFVVGTGARAQRRVEWIDLVATAVLLLAFVGPWLVRRLVRPGPPSRRDGAAAPARSDAAPARSSAPSPLRT